MKKVGQTPADDSDMTSCPPAPPKRPLRIDRSK